MRDDTPELRHQAPDLDNSLLAYRDRMVNKRQHELELIAAFSEIPTSNLAPANLAPKNSVSTLSFCSYIAIGLVVLAYGSIFCFCKIRERRKKRGKKV